MTTKRFILFENNVGLWTLTMYYRPTKLLSLIRTIIHTEKEKQVHLPNKKERNTGQPASFYSEKYARAQLELVYTTIFHSLFFSVYNPIKVFDYT